MNPRNDRCQSIFDQPPSPMPQRSSASMRRSSQRPRSRLKRCRRRSMRWPNASLQPCRPIPILSPSMLERSAATFTQARIAERAAYRYSVNTTVYIAAEARRAGVGRALYSELLPELKRRGFHMAFAGITLPNAASVSLHESVGLNRSASTARSASSSAAGTTSAGGSGCCEAGGCHSACTRAEKI